MTINKKHNGVEIYDLLNGYLFKRFYIGYTLAQAKSLFQFDYKQQKLNESK